MPLPVIAPRMNAATSPRGEKESLRAPSTRYLAGDAAFERHDLEVRSTDVVGRGEVDLLPVGREDGGALLLAGPRVDELPRRVIRHRGGHEDAFRGAVEYVLQ